MKVIIPPSIRRIMQAYPPVEPLTVPPPEPPPPSETIDFWLVSFQVLAIFIVASIVLHFHRLIGMIILSIGLFAIVVRVIIVLRQQTRPNLKKENEYLQALAIYAQTEKNYYDRVAKTQNPEQVRVYRNQELAALRKKLPAFDFVITHSTDRLPNPIEQLKEHTTGHLFYQPSVTIPGIDQTYCPQCILQNEGKTITIVVDQENKPIDQSLIKEFFYQRGIIWIIYREQELEQLHTELNLIWQTIG